MTILIDQWAAHWGLLHHPIGRGNDALDSVQRKVWEHMRELEGAAICEGCQEVIEPHELRLRDSHAPDLVFHPDYLLEESTKQPPKGEKP